MIGSEERHPLGSCLRLRITLVIIADRSSRLMQLSKQRESCCTCKNGLINCQWVPNRIGDVFRREAYVVLKGKRTARIIWLINNNYPVLDCLTSEFFHESDMHVWPYNKLIKPVESISLRWTVHVLPTISIFQREINASSDLSISFFTLRYAGRAFLTAGLRGSYRVVQWCGVSISYYRKSEVL